MTDDLHGAARDRLAQMAMLTSAPFQAFIRECGPGAWDRLQAALRASDAMPVGSALDRVLGHGLVSTDGCRDVGPLNTLTSTVAQVGERAVAPAG